MSRIFFNVSIGLLLTFIFAVIVVQSNDDDDVASKIKQLVEMNSRQAVIRLGYDNYKRLVKSPPRNYSMILMMTALGEHRECEMCHMAFPDYEAAAKSWLYSNDYSSNKVFFALVDVDFDNGMEIFKQLKLQHAPVVMHFPAKGKPKPIDTFDVQKQGGYSAEAILKWVSDRTGVAMKFSRPVDYTQAILITLSGIILIGSLLYLRAKILYIVFSRTLWSILAIAFIMTFLSGQMWNSIRTPPFARQNPRTGRRNFVAPSNSYQFQAESIIVACMYSSIMIGFILMNAAVHIKRQFYKVFTMLFGVTLSGLFFSILLFVFEKKFQGYPYGLSNVIKIDFEL